MNAGGAGTRFGGGGQPFDWLEWSGSLVRVVSVAALDSPVRHWLATQYLDLRPLRAGLAQRKQRTYEKVALPY